MATFPLKIMTPDGVAFDGAVDVGNPAAPSTASFPSCWRGISTSARLLGMGEAHIKLEDGTVRRAACMGGMLKHAFGEECHLLATTFEWADAIDAERAPPAARPVPKHCWPRRIWTSATCNLPRPALRRALVRQQRGPPARIFESDSLAVWRGVFFFELAAKHCCQCLHTPRRACLLRPHTV